MNLREKTKIVIIIILVLTNYQIITQDNINTTNTKDTDFYLTCDKNYSYWTRNKRNLSFPPSLTDLTCNKKYQPTTKLINFFSAASGENFEHLLPLYTYFALSNHHDAIVEIVVPNSTMFFYANAASLTWLFRFSSDGFCIREFSKDHSSRTKVRNTWRYLEVPTQKAKYTYIGDTDIFFVESVLAKKRFDQMNYFELPYSNIVRDYDAFPRRLTGVMLVETERFYTQALIRAQKEVRVSNIDEAFLYDIVVASGLGIPERKKNSAVEDDLLKYRPAHGVHLSYNRGPGKRFCHPDVREIQKLLVFPLFNDYILHDRVGYEKISESLLAAETQKMYKMNHRHNNTCKTSLALLHTSTNQSTEGSQL